MAAQRTAPAPPRPRRMAFPFDDRIPRHWFAGMALPTHVANGINLLFPAGERFFIRALKPYLAHFADEPDMLAQIRGFLGQEGGHAREHERFFQVLEAHGYRIRPFLERYERVTYDIIAGRMSPALRLAATAACEHFTALMAERVLAGDVLAPAHPVMRDLLMWHAAEEIEHKSVAFDVLQRAHPSYALRMRGLLWATVLLAGWWMAATRMLLAQEGFTRAHLRRERARLTRLRGRRAVWRYVLLRGILEYARPGFHPSDRDNRHLAHRYLRDLDQAADVGAPSC